MATGNYTHGAALAPTGQRGHTAAHERSSLSSRAEAVGYPEDLLVWRRAQRSPSTVSTTRISVIIPTLNEAGCLPQTFRSLPDAANLEVIVVDGGSNDGTADVAERAGARVLRLPPGRALQMNAGAAAARGSVLLFLHADTRLPRGFFSAVEAEMRKPGVVGGAFRLRIDAPGWPLRIIEGAVHIRSCILQIPYGDQGIFVRKETFQELDGFAMLPIMEDVDFIRRLRRLGRIRIVPLSATTSGRRWQELGPWKTTWINQKIVFGYCIGISAQRLADWYHRARRPENHPLTGHPMPGDGR